MVRRRKIDEKINELIKQHDTRDPFVIAKEKEVIILLEELGDIFGYYNKVSRIPFIHINCNFPYEKQRFTCMHELGHVIFHPDENTPKLSAVSLCSEIIIEAEANYFATKLTIDGSHHDEYIQTKYDLLRYYGLPNEMIRFL
ncbi:ImmA/IrrE family metallo-endopeptidase [Bacillus thuringiensis]|uniref:ImmA/IrrE family metallo-endopeptidase n=1 Tax=Bacillus thuringiensis TaxID=1428 RepID=UPI003334F728